MFSCYVGLIAPVESSKQLNFITLCQGVYSIQKYKMIVFASLRLLNYLAPRSFDYERT